MDTLKELLFKVHAVIPIYIKIQRFTETFTLAKSIISKVATLATSQK